MPKIKVNDVDFYYELHGEGQPLVLISGYTGDHTQWTYHIDRLSKKFQILTFDNQGVGQTTDDGNSFTVEDMADNTVALCKGLGFGAFSVAGQSMGGSIAQMIAIRHPEAVDKLVLSCTSPKWNEVTIYVFETSFKLIESNTPIQLIYEVITPWCCGCEFLDDPEKMESRRKNIMENAYPPSVSDMHRQFEALKHFDSTSQLGKIQAPTLVISALEDLFASKRNTKTLLGEIANAKNVELDCGHSSPIEKPDEWLRCLVEFLPE